MEKSDAKGGGAVYEKGECAGPREGVAASMARVTKGRGSKEGPKWGESCASPCTATALQVGGGKGRVYG